MFLSLYVCCALDIYATASTMRRERAGEIASTAAESTGESSRLRGATYWTKLAHIKQGSNWNSGGSGDPRPGSRALGSAGNGALGARSRARKRNPRLRIPYSLSQPAASSPLPPLALSPSPAVRASSDITPPRSLSAPLSVSSCFLLPSPAPLSLPLCFFLSLARRARVREYSSRNKLRLDITSRRRIQ